MNVWEFEDKLKSLVQELGLDCTVVSDNSIYYPMVYKVSDNSIRFNTGQVLGISGQTGYSLEDTFMCIAYHEIGHYLDFKQHPEYVSELKQRDRTFVYEREKAAVILGREIISDERLIDIYDALNIERLNRYKKKYQIQD